MVSGLIAVVLAYLMGSLSFAVLVSRWMGLADPRSYGSGNPGATNVLRTGNRKAAAITLLLDAVKGLVPVLLAKWLGDHWGWGDGVIAMVGMAAFLGHVWPVLFGFQGGKGVATAAGVLLGFDWLLGGAVLAIWLLLAWSSRYSSLAALSAAVAAPLVQWLIGGMGPITWAVLAMAGVLVWRHSANIGKLMAGTEGKIGQKS